MRELDFYDVLGVHPRAEEEVISAAYRALAKKYHPDSGNGSASSTRFMHVQEAYDVLRDPTLRRQYDEWRAGRAAHSPSPATEDREASKASSSSSRPADKSSRSGQKSEDPTKPRTSAGDQPRPQASRQTDAKRKRQLGLILLLCTLAIATTVLVMTINRGHAPEASRATEDLTDQKVTLSGDREEDAEVRDDNQQNAGSKQIYDRIIGEQEVAGDSDVDSGPARANSQQMNSSAKGNQIAPYRSPDQGKTGLPEVAPPPPLPIPGSEP